MRYQNQIVAWEAASSAHSDEPRWHGVDQFIAGRAERRVEVSHSQIQNARQRAFKGQDEVWIARRSAQLSISSSE
jgi:hypothetical protein